MKKISHIPFRFAVIILFSALTFSSCGRKATETIFIISTNDIHGAIEKIPNLATLVNEYRSQDTAAVILVDAGDRWTGNPYVDMAPEEGKPIIDLMNELDYDLATYGNHEFDKGLEHLQLRNEGAEFEIILANVDTGETAWKQPDAYTTVITDKGTRLTFLGLVTNFINGHPDGKDEIFEGTTFHSPYLTAERYSHLREETDVLVGLTHIGDVADSILAVSVPVFNLIIGGHTHTVMEEPRIYGKTVVTQTGKGLRYAGVTKITMKKHKVASIENHLVKLDAVAPDPDFAQAVSKYYDNEKLQSAIGTLASDMNQNGVANFVTDRIREKTNTDFSFYHIGGIRVTGLPAGTIKLSDMYAIEPFASKAHTIRLTLAEIKQLIINKYNDTVNPKEAHRPDIYPSGMNYIIVTNEEDMAVDVVFDFSYLYSSSYRYSVAISDYMYEQYKFDKPEQEAESEYITDMLTDYFMTRKSVTPDNRERIRIQVR